MRFHLILIHHQTHHGPTVFSSVIWCSPLKRLLITWRESRDPCLMYKTVQRIYIYIYIHMLWHIISIHIIHNKHTTTSITKYVVNIHIHKMDRHSSHVTNSFLMYHLCTETRIVRVAGFEVLTTPLLPRRGTLELQTTFPKCSRKNTSLSKFGFK